MPKYGMVIDLQKCVGCGGCAIACKTENNTQDRKDGQTFNWADHLIEMKGTFPNVSYENKPVLCNHCSKAACVEVCPVTPKAMYKGEDNITMHSNERCIGCRMCQRNCPYSATDVDREDADYSVISFNDFSDDTQPFYKDDDALVEGGTSTGSEISALAGDSPPYRTRYVVDDGSLDVRSKGVVEKCTFCPHRVHNGLDPYCVETCPSGARVFGDLDDPSSAVSRILRSHRASVLKPEAGTEPNVFYIRNFQA